jgi:hypothetical protein
MKRQAAPFARPNAELLTRVAEATSSLGDWLERQDYAGNDPYQLDHLISRVGDRPLIGPIMGFARRMLKPYHALIPKRLFQAAPAVVIPQALGDVLSGEGLLPPDEQVQRRAQRLFSLIKQTRSPLAREAGWGLPFYWGGTAKHPPHWPATITTTIVMEGLLDALHLLNREEVLALVASGVRFMTEECGVAHLPEGDCIFYGPKDTRLILNASIAAGALLARAARELERDDLAVLARRTATLVTHYQNADGSWYYSPAHAEHPVDTIIDGRHTGYILEGLITVNADFGDARVAEAIERGWAYSKEHLIDGEKPRWSPDQTWPIDAHDVAQAIMTALAYGDHDLANRHMAFAMDRFYAGDGKFRYKAFENGDSNNAVFIRWTQAPMYKAMVRYLAMSATDAA